MMKITGRVTSCCVALFLALTSVSAVQIFDSIDDLKRINFGQSVSKHSLLLLHWFANVVDIDNNNIWLTFDPEEDYGSHHYGNYEGMLDQPPRGYKYYTVGNIGQHSATELPPYVLHPPSSEYEGSNRDRIIFRAREGRIDQVYITQHYENQRTHDPDHTYQVTANLLRQIREFSVGENQQTLLDLRNSFGSHSDIVSITDRWGDLACLGLLLFIVIYERHSQKRYPLAVESTSLQKRPSREGADEVRTESPVRNREPSTHTSEPQSDDGDEVAYCLLCFAFTVFLLAMILSFFKSLCRL